MFSIYLLDLKKSPSFDFPSFGFPIDDSPWSSIQVQLTELTAITVVTRLISDTFEVSVGGCEVQSSVCPEVLLRFPAGAVETNIKGSLMVQYTFCYLYHFMLCSYNCDFFPGCKYKQFKLGSSILSVMRTKSTTCIEHVCVKKLSAFFPTPIFFHLFDHLISAKIAEFNMQN